MKYIEPLGSHTDSACIWDGKIMDYRESGFDHVCVTHNCVALMIVSDALRLIVTRHTFALGNLRPELFITKKEFKI